MQTRVEKDSMGEMRVPADALWGASTQRAVENFPISGRGLRRPFLRALGLIKEAAAATNAELKDLDPKLAEVIGKAAAEVAEGKLDRHFVVDVYQTGSGTSTNMNANEVIANRAAQLMGKPIGSRDAVHPNDHVNRGQSSNDVIPTALHVACAEEIARRLLPALEHLHEALAERAKAFDPIVKIGRTHLQDATPVRLGQVFSGFAQQVQNAAVRLQESLPHLCELALGGTAVGTGINCPPRFAEKTIARLAEMTGIHFVEAPNHFEAQAARDAAVEISGALKTVAVSLWHVANNIRFLSCGPRCGIGEIVLPATQPGSSIMPGKVNPVMSEMLMQVAMRAIGNDATVTAAGTTGLGELNVAIPVIADALLESIELMTNGARAFADKCVKGIEADEERCGELIEKSLMLCTALAPKIGYDKAAAIAKKAHEQRKTVRQVAEEMGIKDLETLLDVRSMT
ncbi:MAG TPA: class II fumarate hydratase [Planctomycetota bacterium]|nr:class II fumarate hydratase [Planctomycetota bacterium]